MRSNFNDADWIKENISLGNSKTLHTLHFKHCVCAAEDDKDHYVEESEVTPCETRAEEPFLLQKPVTRARLEARTESLQRTDSLQVRRSV